MRLTPSAICSVVASGPSQCELIDHRESPGATTTRSAAPAARPVSCGSFPRGVALALAAAGAAAETIAHNVNTAIVTICTYTHHLSLVIKAVPLT